MKKKILGTSDTWSMIRLSNHPSKPAYYIVNWRIFKFRLMADRITELQKFNQPCLGLTFLLFWIFNPAFRYCWSKVELELFWSNYAKYRGLNLKTINYRDSQQLICLMVQQAECSFKDEHSNGKQRFFKLLFFKVSCQEGFSASTPD